MTNENVLEAANVAGPQQNDAAAREANVVQSLDVINYFAAASGSQASDRLFRKEAPVASYPCLSDTARWMH